MSEKYETEIVERAAKIGRRHARSAAYWKAYADGCFDSACVTLRAYGSLVDRHTALKKTCLELRKQLRKATR